MEFKKLKEEAKKVLSANYKFLLLLFLPLWITKALLVGVATNVDLNAFKSILEGHTAETSNPFTSILTVIMSGLLLSAMFILI